MAVKNIEFSSGYITVTFDSGPPVQYPVADMLRAADIPVLTIDKVTVLTELADLFVTLLRTLIERKVLDEEFSEGFDLDYIHDVLTDNLGAERSLSTRARSGRSRIKRPPPRQPRRLRRLVD